MDIDSVIKYRTKLIEYGKRASIENPDRLNNDELQALTVRIFDMLNQLDMSLGYDNHDTGIRKPESVDKDRQEELFTSFIDWYGIIPEGSTLMNNYVQKNYPQNKYKKVICVGDGEWCHLGRKLANRGYDVVVVDPFSKKEFEMSADDKHGSLHVVKGKFFDTSKDMIDWSDIIVGVKVPLCAEDLTKLDKPTIFSISNNPEIYNMRFKGVPIKSAEQLQNEIERISKVKRVNFRDYLGYDSHIYVCDERQREADKGLYR